MVRDMRNYVARGFEDALQAAGIDPRRTEVRHAIANAVSPIAMEFGLRDRLIRDMLEALGSGSRERIEALEARARIVLEEEEG